MNFSFYKKIKILVIIILIFQITFNISIFQQNLVIGGLLGILEAQANCSDVSKKDEVLIPDFSADVLSCHAHKLKDAKIILQKHLPLEAITDCIGNLKKVFPTKCTSCPQLATEESTCHEMPSKDLQDQVKKFLDGYKKIDIDQVDPALLSEYAANSQLHQAEKKLIEEEHDRHRGVERTKAVAQAMLVDGPLYAVTEKTATLVGKASHAGVNKIKKIKKESKIKTKEKTKETENQEKSGDVAEATTSEKKKSPILLSDLLPPKSYAIRYVKVAKGIGMMATGVVGMTASVVSAPFGGAAGTPIFAIGSGIAVIGSMVEYGLANKASKREKVILSQRSVPYRDSPAGEDDEQHLSALRQARTEGKLELAAGVVAFISDTPPGGMTDQTVVRLTQKVLSPGGATDIPVDISHFSGLSPADQALAILPFAGGWYFTAAGAKEVYDAFHDKESLPRIFLRMEKLHKAMIMKDIDEKIKQLNKIYTSIRQVPQADENLSKLHCLCAADSWLNKFKKNAELAFEKRFKFLNEEERKHQKDENLRTSKRISDRIEILKKNNQTLKNIVDQFTPTTDLLKKTEAQHKKSVSADLDETKGSLKKLNQLEVENAELLKTVGSIMNGILDDGNSFSLDIQTVQTQLAFQQQPHGGLGHNSQDEEERIHYLKTKAELRESLESHEVNVSRVNKAIDSIMLHLQEKRQKELERIKIAEKKRKEIDKEISKLESDENKIKKNRLDLPLGLADKGLKRIISEKIKLNQESDQLKSEVSVLKDRTESVSKISMMDKIKKMLKKIKVRSDLDQVLSETEKVIEDRIASDQSDIKEISDDSMVNRSHRTIERQEYLEGLEEELIEDQKELDTIIHLKKVLGEQK